MTELSFKAEIAVDKEIMSRLHERYGDYYWNADQVMTDLAERFMDACSSVEDASYSYLGFLSALFVAPIIVFEDDAVLKEGSVFELKDVFDAPYRSFVDGISDQDGKLVVCYRAGHDASEGFWKVLFSKSLCISSVVITVDDDYPEDVEEMGEGFRIEIKR